MAPKSKKDGAFVQVSLDEIWHLFRDLEARQRRVEIGLVVVALIALGRYGGEIIGRWVGA